MELGVPQGWLRQWRKKRHMTLEQMGDLTGYHWISIWRMENGHRKCSRRLLAMITQVQKGEASKRTKKASPTGKRKKKGQVQHGKRR